MDLKVNLVPKEIWIGEEELVDGMEIPYSELPKTRDGYEDWEDGELVVLARYVNESSTFKLAILRREYKLGSSKATVVTRLV